MNSYSCPTKVITTFYSLSVSGAAISRYPSMVLIISARIFFFNKNIACMSSVSVFMANASNSIIKSAICFLPYWNVLIFHSASAALFLLLKAVLISLMNSFQSWMSSVFFSLLIFFYTKISAIPPLSQASIVVILSFTATTLLFLRNNWIPLH